MCFNPRLREGGDVKGQAIVALILVSIHASAREATRITTCMMRHYPCFNPRLREGGDGDIGAADKREISFNPRLREGGDPGEQGNPVTSDVSIHASAREATCYRGRGNKANLVSIHASAREATRPLAVCALTVCFNPRLREGGDSDHFD